MSKIIKIIIPTIVLIIITVTLIIEYTHCWDIQLGERTGICSFIFMLIL